jgi:rhamnogalacturonyl hydrolase YesR
MKAQDLEIILTRIYQWSERQHFRGYNKHDGLNSPILNKLLGWGKWPRIIAIQSVMRSPINIRPLLGVKKTFNPKGLALFVQGLLDLYESTNDIKYLEAARSLLELLVEIKSTGNWSGICWGYHYPWQDPGFFAPTNTPNAVVTCFVCEAFLDAYFHTNEPRYLNIVSSALSFFLNDLTVLKDTEDELCLAYMPLPMSMRVMDVSILIGAVISRYNQYSFRDCNQNVANRLVRYVVNQQTDYSAWYYTDPPNDSHITHDNYHTGFILDALMRYMTATGCPEYQDVYKKGLHFYAKNFFNADGSPRWMNDKDYPHDIHGSAQGIITFSRHFREYPGLAENISGWTLDKMYNNEGRFYYQETRLYKKRFSLLRWCNAWMFRALASLYKYTVTY